MTRRSANERLKDLSAEATWPPTGEALAAAIAAFTNPRRRELVDHLVMHGPATVGILARALDMPVGSASHHLQVLARAGFVELAENKDGDARQTWWQAIPRDFRWSDEHFVPGPGQELAKAATDASLRFLIDSIHQWRKASPPQDWEGTITSALIPATKDQLVDVGQRIAAVIKEWSDECAETAKGDDTGELRLVRVVALSFPQVTGRG